MESVAQILSGEYHHDSEWFELGAAGNGLCSALQSLQHCACCTANLLSNNELNNMNMNLFDVSVHAFSSHLLTLSLCNALSCLGRK